MPISEYVKSEAVTFPWRTGPGSTGGWRSPGSCESRRHRRHRQRRHERAARARRTSPRSEIRARRRAAAARAVAAEGRVGARRRLARSTSCRVFAGADAVVHLAWLIQPSRDRGHAARDQRRRQPPRVRGRRRGRRRRRSSTPRRSAPTRPGPKDRAVDESWPTGGIQTSFYSRHKAEVERMLDGFEREHPDMRVVRLRPGPDLQARGGRRRSAACSPARSCRAALVRRRLHPGRARHRRACASRPCTRSTWARPTGSRSYGDARGAFNVAAEPVLDPTALGRAARRAAGAASAPACCAPRPTLTWRARLQPTPPGWVDMALGVPIMDTTRAREELGWAPRHDGGEALLELLERHARRRGLPDPAAGPGRLALARAADRRRRGSPESKRVGAPHDATRTSAPPPGPGCTPCSPPSSAATPSRTG